MRTAVRRRLLSAPTRARVMTSAAQLGCVCDVQRTAVRCKCCGLHSCADVMTRPSQPYIFGEAGCAAVRVDSSVACTCAERVITPVQVYGSSNTGCTRVQVEYAKSSAFIAPCYERRRAAACHRERRRVRACVGRAGHTYAACTADGSLGTILYRSQC
jgi:hypothetical protein